MDPRVLTHSVMDTFLPLLLIQEKQVVSYWQKNGHKVLVNCLWEACPESVWLGD